MNSEPVEIFVFGASGHAKVVIDIIERQEFYKIVFLIDDNPLLKGREFFGYIVRGGKKDLLALSNPPCLGIVAIGENGARGRVAGWLREHGFTLATAIHPSAQIGRDVSIGQGSVVMAGAVINSATKLGENVIVNTGASIDHDCIVGNVVHLAPGSTLCGTVTIGDGAFVCAGATVIPNLTIGKGVTIGAGATVICDVVDGVIAVGSPARELIKSKG